MEKLPIEICFDIIRRLPMIDILHLGACNRHFYQITKSEELWIFLDTRRYKKRKVEQRSVRERFIHKYQAIDWFNDYNILRFQLNVVIKNYTKYDCEPPSEPRTIFDLITNNQFENNEMFDEIPLDEITEEYNKEFLKNICLVSLVFFSENFPNLLEPFLFKKFTALQGNSIISLLFFAHSTFKRAESIDCTRVLRALTAIIDYYPDQTLRYLTEPAYVHDTTNREQRFHSSGIRKIVHDNGYRILDIVVRKYGVEPFVAEILRCDEVDYTILTDITAAHSNRGGTECETLKILYKHFKPQLHHLLRSHLRLYDLPNSFLAISNTKNMQFIKQFLMYFDKEARVFIDWTRENPPPLDASFKYYKSCAFIESHVAQSGVSSSN